MTNDGPGPRHEASGKLRLGDRCNHGRSGRLALAKKSATFPWQHTAGELSPAAAVSTHEHECQAVSRPIDRRLMLEGDVTVAPMLLSDALHLAHTPASHIF